jgi:NitT/TauT family transport system ATP-binding protein
MSQLAIDVEDIHFQDAEIHVPRFELKRGEKVLLMGPSGCGKTSFLEFLAGFREAKWQKREILDSPSVVFQDLNLIEEFSINENLKIELEAEQIKKAYKWLGGLEFSIPQSVLVKRLSKGEQQRLSVVRALAKSRFILADEPTSHLDRHRADKLIGLIAEIAETALIVSHDAHLSQFFDRVVMFEELLR